MSVLQSKARSFGLGVVPAFAVAMLPKWPLCWMAIFGALGLGSIISLVWLQWLTILFLVMALAALAIRAHRIHRYGPLVLGAAAAVAVYFSNSRLIWTRRSIRRADACSVPRSGIRCSGPGDQRRRDITAPVTLQKAFTIFPFSRGENHVR